MEKLDSCAPLVGRVLLTIIFLVSGYGKSADPARTAAHMGMVGLPGFLAWPTAIFELALGASVILGFQVRIRALLGAGLSILSALMFHLDFADQMQSINVMKNLAIAGGFLYVFAFGAGAFAIDKR